MLLSLFFFCNDPATTEIYTLSLHDALPISRYGHVSGVGWPRAVCAATSSTARRSSSPLKSLPAFSRRSEEHTSELQSHSDLVCRLLLEKKKKKNETPHTYSTNNQTAQAKTI